MFKKQVDKTRERIGGQKIDLNEIIQNEIQREKRIGRYEEK